MTKPRKRTMLSLKGEINKVTIELTLASMKLQELLEMMDDYLEVEELQNEIQLSIKGEGND